MVGEKNLDPDYYATGQSLGDNQAWDAGWTADNVRVVGLIGATPACRLSSRARHARLDPTINFGSAHSNGFGMAFCDGSVTFLSYTIDLETNRRLGDRDDACRSTRRSSSVPGRRSGRRGGFAAYAGRSGPAGLDVYVARTDADDGYRDLHFVRHGLENRCAGRAIIGRRQDLLAPGAVYPYFRAIEAECPDAGGRNVKEKGDSHQIWEKSVIAHFL